MPVPVVRHFCLLVLNSLTSQALPLQFWRPTSVRDACWCRSRLTSITRTRCSISLSSRQTTIDQRQTHGPPPCKPTIPTAAQLGALPSPPSFLGNPSALYMTISVLILNYGDAPGEHAPLSHLDGPGNRARKSPQFLARPTFANCGGTSSMNMPIARCWRHLLSGHARA